MPWVFFAFRRPPEAVSHIFKVPSIFTFLPEKRVMPAGRLFVGVLCIAVCIFLYVKLSPVV